MFFRFDQIFLILVHFWWSMMNGWNVYLPLSISWPSILNVEIYKWTIRIYQMLRPFCTNHNGLLGHARMTILFCFLLVFWHIHINNNYIRVWPNENIIWWTNDKRTNKTKTSVILLFKITIFLALDKNTIETYFWWLFRLWLWLYFYCCCSLDQSSFTFYYYRIMNPFRQQSRYEFVFLFWYSVFSPFSLNGWMGLILLSSDGRLKGCVTRILNFIYKIKNIEIWIPKHTFIIIKRTPGENDNWKK